MTDAYDHRASIIKYIESQADKYEANGQKDSATALRATASSLTAQLDTPEEEAAVMTSPAMPLIIHAIKALGGSTVRELLSVGGPKAMHRVRYAAIWAVKQRFGWSHEAIGAEFHRDASTISSALSRAEEMRSEDPEFKRVTDAMVKREYHCLNCLHPLAIA